MLSLTTALRYVRHGPFDASTEEGRSAERYRRAALAAVSGFASRAMSMVTLVIAVHVSAKYLGTERFGVWMTFSSLISMLSFLDLGVGNALVNRVAHAMAAGSQDAMRRAVSGGVGVLSVIGMSVSALLVVLSTLVPWTQLFKVSEATSASEVSLTALVFGALFGVNMLSSGFLKILIGQQRAFEANLLSAAGSVIACLAVTIAATRYEAGIPVLMLVTFGLQSLTGFVAIPLLLADGSLATRNILLAALAERQHLLRTGGLFLALQLGSLVGLGADSFVLASIQGATQVAIYAVVQRLFQFASQPVAILNAPLWAAYADASARSDTAFIRKTLRRSVGLSVGVAAAISLVLVFLGPVVIPIWTNHTIAVPTLILLLFATWTVMEAGGMAFGIYLNGCGVVKAQVWIVLGFCALALPLKLAMASLQGAVGILAATICSYLVVVVGGYATVFRKKAFAPLGFRA